MAAPAFAVPPIDTGDSPESHSHILGEIDQDGFAHLDGERGQNLEVVLEQRPGMTSRPSGMSTSTSEEDYDKISIDPSTVVQGSRGGNLPSEPTLDSPLRAHQHLDSSKPKRPSYDRRQSIPIKLQKTGTKGRYLLMSDDPEVREILQRGLQPEASSQKRRTRFSDLVFTRQFTAFDRQNPTSASSPFHGFFTLFWLAIGFMLIKVAANNWRSYGSIFGNNEILTMMFHRDVVVLGLTDVAMMSSTVFCLMLQKTISAKLISWNGLGWVVQSVRTNSNTYKALRISGTYDSCISPKRHKSICPTHMSCPCILSLSLY